MKIRKRKYRLYIVYYIFERLLAVKNLPIVFLLLGATLFIIFRTSDKGGGFKPFNNSVSIIVFFTISLSIIGTLYLFKFLINDKDEENDRASSISLRHQYLETQRNIEDRIRDTLSKNPNLLDIEKSVYEKILSNLESTLINKLDERFKNNIKTEFITNSIISELDPLTNNVEKYIDRIQRNSIVNLFIGILGTVSAITILALAILIEKAFPDFQTFLIHILPRLTFVIVIQLFAFFFLRLYKNNLEDAKYFQNELTNLTAKSSAIKISYLMGNTDKVSELLKDLATIERNFKLFKDESTMSLEKAKLENGMDKIILDKMNGLLSRFETKK